LKLLYNDVLGHRVVEALRHSGGASEPAINGMRIDVLDPGDGGATHVFDTHRGHTFNAWLRRSESMIKGVGGTTIGLATGATTVTPSSSTLESVTSKADDMVGLPAFRTMQIGAGKKMASTAMRHWVPSQL
jgi:hypothetical protein